MSKKASLIALALLVLVCLPAPFLIREQGNRPIEFPEGFSEKPVAVPPMPEEEGVFCTQDAMLCPDGSYVGRTGPKCEFAPCPSSPEVPLTGIRKYGEPVTLQPGEVAAYDDGATVTLVAINDSRCAKDVVCIWAGELGVTLRVESGGTSEEVNLGMTTRTEAVALGHTFTLQDVMEATATFAVSREMK